MSRGHGTVQQAILNYLKSGAWAEVGVFANIVAGFPKRGPDRSAVESTRRALKKLAEEGLVEFRHKAWEQEDTTCPTCGHVKRRILGSHWEISSTWGSEVRRVSVAERPANT